MSVREFQRAAKRAQKLADAEMDPQLKAGHAQRADELNQWAEIAQLQTKLEKAIAAHKKGVSPRQEKS